MNFRIKLWIIASVWIAAAVAGGKKPQAAAAPRDLVWPLPPETPRIRWLAEYTDLTLLKGGPKKASWVERVTGARTAPTKDEIKRPYGIAADSHGRIFVADSEQRSVLVLNPAMHAYERRTGSSRAPLALPVGVALDSSDRLFVSDAALHSILCFSPGGEVLAYFGTTDLQRPGGIAVDSKRGLLYVPDAQAHRVVVFDTRGFRVQRVIGGPSTNGRREPGKFAAPSNVALDHQGNLYVTDTWNHRIQIFGADGKFIRAFGTQGTRPGQFIRPKGIAVDSEGHVYVADAEFNNFQILTSKGEPLLAVGALGLEPGRFALLTGIAIDSEDRIYTTEQYRGRVQVFQYLAAPGSRGVKEVSQNTSHE